MKVMLNKNDFLFLEIPDSLTLEELSIFAKRLLKVSRIYIDEDTNDLLKISLSRPQILNQKKNRWLKIEEVKKLLEIHQNFDNFQQRKGEIENYLNSIGINKDFKDNNSYWNFIINNRERLKKYSNENINNDTTRTDNATE